MFTSSCFPPTAALVVALTVAETIMSIAFLCLKMIFVKLLVVLFEFRKIQKLPKRKKIHNSVFIHSKIKVDLHGKGSIFLISNDNYFLSIPPAQPQEFIKCKL